MTDGPTQGAIDSETEDGQWRSARWAAICVRVAVVAVPFIAAWFAVSALSALFLRPPGWTGLGIWILQAVLTGTVVSMVTERFTRKLMPLATLLNLSLVFPDQAPSRFGVALRSGSLRKLQDGFKDVKRHGLGSDDRDAAQQAVELIGLLSHHDRLTRGHTERVRAYADLIGEEMGLSHKERSRLAWGSLLHDVGKLAVPSEILNKSGRPTDAEWAILKNHPKATGELLEPLEGWLGEWSKAGTEHHERWDGTGYPAGLAGHEISLAGRITAVADAYDVITSKRSYKAPMSATTARQELVACAGSQFDPEVVRAFLNVSLGHRWLTGPLAWIGELPRLTNIAPGLSSAPAVLAGTAVAVAATITSPVSPAVGETFEPVLAFVTETTVVPVDTTVAVTVSKVSVIETDESNDPSDEPPPATETSTTSLDETTTTIPPQTTQAPQTTTISTTALTTITTAAPTTTAPPTTTTTAPATTTTTTSATTTTTVAGSWAADDTKNGVYNEEHSVWVLDNDTPPTGFDYVTLRVVAQPANGAASVVTQGPLDNRRLKYQANDGFVGVDTFTYEICDLNGSCSTATVTFTSTAP